ncbi:MAG: hypothetical protein GEU28_09510 [Dehalococcoidia bacterium]|nr:hypothetical protein [Dehalococcoidia bacterium]
MMVNPDLPQPMADRMPRIGVAIGCLVAAVAVACGDGGDDSELSVPLDEITETSARYGDDDEVVVVRAPGGPRAYWYIGPLRLRVLLP